MRSAALGATQDATASHKTGLEIRTLSINESGTHAILAGKEIFKTVRIEDGQCTEDFNLRMAIRSAPTQASGQARHVHAIDIADVAWAKGDTGNYVAAATSSGKIMLYDLGHAGLPAAQLHEHDRQVHNLSFSPHSGSYLLSGSQDGTVRLWDVRDARKQMAEMKIRSRSKFSGQSDGVRDVKWSPTEGLDFAFATDTGEVQRWDMRYSKAPKVRVPAHTLSCNTVDWHPDGKHVVTAGSDMSIRVFDISGGRSKKATWEIKTAHPVMNVRWRPSCRSMLPQDNGAGTCTQVVAAYDREHPILHIWDFRRPHLPFREFRPYHSAPTDLLWHSQDLLWTVGREGTFLQTDVQYTSKVIDRCHLQAIDVSPLGELTFAAQSRHQRRMPKPHTNPTPQSQPGSLGTSPDFNFLSRSWVDDGLDSSFLSLLPVQGRNRSVDHNRISSTPIHTSNNQNVSAIIKLDDVLLNKKFFRPQQASCRGELPGSNSRKFVAFIAKHSRLDFGTAPNDEEFLRTVEQVFKRNADHADAIGFLRAAQTWKIVSYSVLGHLRKRLAFSKKWSTEKSSPALNRKMETSILSLAHKFTRNQLKSPAHSPRTMQPASGISQHLTAPPQESTSNVPTPRGREHHKEPLPDLEASERLTLPPSLTSGQSIELGTSARRLTINNLADMQKNQTYEETAERSEMVKRWSAQSKNVLSLDPVDNNGIKIPLSKLENRGSCESFRFLEGDSTGSRDSSFPASFESNKAGKMYMVSERLTRAKAPSKQPSDPEAVSIANQSMLFLGSGTLADSSTIGEGPSRRSGPTSSNGEPEDGDIYKADLAPKAPTDRRVGTPKPRIEGNPSSYTGHAKATSRTIETIINQQSPTSPTGGDEETETDLEENAVWTLINMLRQLTHFYTHDQPYPQMASMLLLLVGPLLPRTHPLPAHDIHQTISSYVDYYINTLGYHPEDVPSLIRQSFDQSLRAGLQPLQIESILTTYHDQLLHYQLHEEATFVRKLAYPAYPAVYEDFLHNTTIHPTCGHCHQPLSTSSSSSHSRCEACHRKPNPCPICWMDRSPYETLGSALHTCCVLCGHSGHAACVAEWFLGAAGEGCPTPGCLCECVVGTRVRETMVREEREAKVKALGRVRSDEWRVRESRAVVGVRGELKK
jgi:WD40 repeat protein